MTDAVGHGKIILFGEHAVVHGCPALAMALPRGALARAQVSDVDRLHVLPFDSHIVLDGRVPEPELSPLYVAFEAALADAPGGRPRLAVQVELQVPAGAGLGASAALSVAILRAIDAALGRTRPDAEIIEASLRWERVFHGNPSGVDSAMAAAGGVAVFRKGEPLVPVPVSRLPALVVGHSGSAPSTREMVESVARQLARDPDKVRGIFEAIESIVINGRSALLRGDWKALGQLMVLNQQLLNTLLLSTSRLEAMCQAAIAAGALGAKLTGGGGGGCMIALAQDSGGAKAICDRLGDQFGAEAFVVGQGGSDAAQRGADA